MKDKPIINILVVNIIKECILQIEYLQNKFQQTGTGNAVIAKANYFIDTFQDAPETTAMKMPIFSDELIDFLELKLESEKSSFENYEVNATNDVFDDAEIKELYHKDMKIVNELTILINYLNQKNKP